MNSTKCFIALRSPAGNEKSEINYCSSPIVIPAEAGIHGSRPRRAWIPAFAGMTDPNPSVARSKKYTRLRRVLTALATLVWLSGCMAGPDYQRPPVATPGVFRGSRATAPDPQSIADLKWFEVFQDEQLQELIRTALVQNYDLRDAIARVDAARANLGITQADQYPTFGVGADVTAIEASRRGEQTIPRGISRQRTLATREESLRLIKVQQQGGVATLLDVRQGEQLVYSAAESIPNTERQIEQTENQISLLLGRNPEPVTRGRLLTEQQTPPEVPAGLPSSLLERRPDIQAAEQTLIAANANIGVAKAAYFPQITLTGEFGFQSTALANLFSGSRRIWTFIPQLTYPIFDAGRIRSGVELAEAEQRSALAQYEKAIQTGFRDVSDALIQYQKVREVRAERELLVTALLDRKRLAYLRYRGGVDTLLNALDADRDLFNAELSLAQIRLSELLSLVQLYKALGGGWQE